MLKTSCKLTIALHVGTARRLSDICFDSKEDDGPVWKERNTGDACIHVFDRSFDSSARPSGVHVL